MDRTTFIGGSDAVRLVNGDWENLYLEKIGEKQPDDLSDNLQVQIGIATEQLNVEWFVKNHSNNLDMNMIERNKSLGVYMIDHVPCAANLDGLITQIKTRGTGFLNANTPIHLHLSKMSLKGTCHKYNSICTCTDTE